MTEKLIVREADRLAYLEWSNLPPRDRDAVLAGEWDSTTGMQVMARHREAAVAETVARLERGQHVDGVEWLSTKTIDRLQSAEAAVTELRATLEGWAEWHRKVCVDHDDDLTYLNDAGWDDADKLAEHTRAALTQKELNG